MENVDPDASDAERNDITGTGYFLRPQGFRHVGCAGEEAARGYDGGCEASKIQVLLDILTECFRILSIAGCLLSEGFRPVSMIVA
ncbi:MAG: hypothetical protein HP493_13220 [Nitrospira sp.]|nr:hypothetical protein [Nitrospira sp.]